MPPIIKIPETFPLNIVTFCSPACSSSCCLCTTRRPGGYCRARANNRLLYRLGRPKGRHPQFLGFKNGLLSVSYSGARALYAIMRQHLLWLAVGSHSDIFYFLSLSPLHQKYGFSITAHTLDLILVPCHEEILSSFCQIFNLIVGLLVRLEPLQRYPKPHS